eukprot:m.96064 g.96064  ORF g.96064 m.96064 type:complete len:384 (+) comp12349_c0_seq1:152-1303(+)
MSGFHVPGHHVAAPPRSPQLSDAASFVATVKTQAPESYATFLDVLNQYQTGQLDVIAVQVRMELMFARHTHLVVGFREFLPENTERVSYWTVQTHRHLATEVKAWVLNLLLCAQRFFARSAQHASQAVRAVPPLSSALWRNILMGLKFSDFCWNTPPPRGKPQQKLKVSDALNYIDLVRTTFADDPSVYNSFLDAMRDFKQSLIDTPGVIRAVGVLFKGREDLISGFKIFLPPGWLMYPRETRCLVPTLFRLMPLPSTACFFKVFQPHPCLLFPRVEASLPRRAVVKRKGVRGHGAACRSPQRDSGDHSTGKAASVLANRNVVHDSGMGVSRGHGVGQASRCSHGCGCRPCSYRCPAVGLQSHAIPDSVFEYPQHISLIFDLS